MPDFIFSFKVCDMHVTKLSFKITPLSKTLTALVFENCKDLRRKNNKKQ
jgi:hypothetical protein